MKTSQKVFLLLVMTGGFVISSSSPVIAQDDNAIAKDDNLGVFKTIQDYLNENLTEYSKMSLGYNSVKGVFKGKKIYSQYKDADFWGIEDAKGVMYRVNKKNNTIDQIILPGKIFYYAGMELVIKGKGEVGYKRTESVDIKAGKGVGFSDIFWVSVGPDGDMIPASKENLLKLLADSPDLVAKVQKIDETNADNWVDTYAGIATIIGKYDKAHPNDSSGRAHK